jgi:TP901 family phage tail tape measure protein
MAAETRITAVIDAEDKASPVLRKFGLNLKTLSAGAVAGFVGALGVKAVKAAAEFETALTNISTLMDGDATEATEKLSKGILEITKSVPKSAQELGVAAYDIFSAGITDIAEALNVLESSAKLATAGLGDTQEAADLMTSALNSFKSEGIKADEVANVFFKTVKAGKTTVAGLAQSFGMIAPLASTVGVGFKELQAATAALTTTGLTASIAQTQLRGAISNLIKPGKALDTMMWKLGFNSGEAMIKQLGLVGTFEKLKQASEDMEVPLSFLFTSIEGLNAVMSLTGEQGKAFTDTMNSMSDETDKLTEAVEKQKETFNAQIQLLKNNLFPALLSLGNTILPIVKDGIDILIPAINNFRLGLEMTINDIEKLGRFVFEVKKKLDDFFDSLNRVAQFNAGGIVGGLAGQIGSKLMGGVAGKALFGVDKFQSGGVVPGKIGQPQMAIVHGGERISPPSGLRVGGGAGIVVNITGNNISNDMDLEVITDKVGQELMRQLRFTQNAV